MHSRLQCKIKQHIIHPSKRVCENNLSFHICGESLIGDYLLASANFTENTGA